MKKILLIAGLLLNISLLTGQQMPAQLVKVAPVTTAPDITMRRYTGHLESVEEVALTTRVSGDLEKVNFEEGTLVKAGQELYRLDDVRYRAQVAVLKARIAQAKARLYYSERSYERTRKLFEKGVDTQDTLDQIYSTLEGNKAELANAEANLILAQDDLKHTRIFAPLDGKIGLTRYTPGNYLTPGSGVLANIVRLDPIRMVFSLSNRDFMAHFGSEAQLKKLAQIRIRLADGSLYPETGKIAFMDNKASLRTDTVKVFVDFKNSDYSLLPGSTVTVNLIVDRHKNIPAIPPTALLRNSRTAYVYVLTPQNTAEFRAVVPGVEYNGLYRIREGLKEGETVISDGTHKVRPGAAVKPVTEKGN